MKSLIFVIGLCMVEATVLTEPDPTMASVVHACGDNRPLVLNTTSTAVTTPGFDQGVYPNNLNCTWKIIAPENKVIRLTTVRLELQGGQSCPYDHIQIFDGANAQSNQLARLCGTQRPQDITSTDNSLYIVFTSDSAGGGEGFKAMYTFELESVANTACDASSRPQVLSGSSGEFTSPSYGPGRNYPDDNQCEWRIRVPIRKKVKLHFDAFDVESDSSCGYDKVEVYEGSSTSGTLQGSFCGDSIPADMLSSGNNLFIKFTSDSLMNRPGFNITYSTENGGGGNGGSNNNGAQQDEIDQLHDVLEEQRDEIVRLAGRLGDLLDRINGQPIVATGVPLGTIVAWVPYLNRDNPVFAGGNLLSTNGWQICDGSLILDANSPWLGERTPDFTDRFLRGGPLSDVLIQQEDQIQDHPHIDGGHTHTEPGHTHTDNGHTHTDGGHTHSHSRTDYVGTGGHISSGSMWNFNRRNTGIGKADIQTSYARISTSQVSLSTDPSGIQGVDVGSTGDVRYGDETRPKATYVVWIMKVAQVTTN